MEENVIDDSSASATINAPVERIDLPAWCFSLPDEEYQVNSPARVAAGSTAARDGRRMSINVDVKPFQSTPASRHQLPRRSL
jgi:hypothetical protein